MTASEIYEAVKREFPSNTGWDGVYYSERFTLGYEETGYIVCYRGGERRVVFDYEHNRSLLSIAIL